jgi:membrane associated rhomboid family serine protease
MVVVLYLCAGAVMLAGLQLLLELTGFGPPWQVVPRMWRRPVPPVAAGLAAVFAVMGVWQTVHPAIIGALERDPGGGWWRVVTALLVQSDGWFQIVFNFAALLVVVPVAARTLGNLRTLAVYLVAGIAAQAVSAAGWSPHGGGDSVAICGLVGALAVGYSLRGTRRDLRLLQLLIPVAALVLCVLTNNHGVGLAVGCMLGVPLAGRLGRPAEDDTHRADRHLGLDR